MRKYVIENLENDVVHVVCCPYCDSDESITFDGCEEDFITGGLDSEYFCDECGSTFYESELDLGILETINMSDINLISGEEKGNSFIEI